MKKNNEKRMHISLEKEFNNWKKKEEKLLRLYGFPESKVKILRDYDHNWFVNNRRRRQDNNDYIYPLSFFEYQPFIPTKEILSFIDLLDSIENEALFLCLKKADPDLQKNNNVSL